MLKVGIHQPNYLPWLGFFYKMANSDIFILLDNVQYEKNGPTNRVKIKTPQGNSWLTLSAERKFPQLVKDIKLADYQKDRENHIKAIELNYKKAKHFDYLFPELENILERDWEYLSQLNIQLIKLIKDKLDIKTEIKLASDYNISEKGSDLLIGLCQQLKADIYLSGEGGQKYQDEEKFKETGIELEHTDFSHPVYSQLWGDFEEGLSIMDLIFNCGPKSFEILEHGK